MKFELYDIKTNIEIGREIFEQLPNGIRPVWAGMILSTFDKYIGDVPKPIADLFPIIENKDRWKEAHRQFEKIRQFLLGTKNYEPEAYLLLAEMVAKVTYNAAGQPAPFDSDSGHYIPGTSLEVAEYFNDDRLEEEVKSTTCLFAHSKKFTNLIHAKDFLLYKKIDDILWLNWDPIGLNEFAPRDEYQSYVPDIFHLVKAHANSQQIAERLFKLQTDNMAMSGSMEKCLTVAVAILRAK